MMPKSFKIVVEVNQQIKVISKREFDFYCKRAANVRVIGTLNQDKGDKLTLYQIQKLQLLIQENIHFLANKSPEMLIKNFNDSVIKELK